jgi:signal transduction histidine kinase
MRPPRRSRDLDLDLVRGAARRLGLQAAALVALAVIILVAISTVLVLRLQNASAEASLRQATASADDVLDPPAGTWLVLRGSDGTQVSPGIPSVFPDLQALDEVTRTRLPRTATIHIGKSQYLVRTAIRGDRTVQAVLDLGPEHDQRSDLTHILLAVGAAGLVLSTFVGTFLARRAVRPLSDALTLQRSFIADASHELRTPLTLLSTRAQLLRRSLVADGADSSAVDDANGVVADVARMTDLVEELLVAADPWTESEVGPVELTSLCEELVASASDYAESNQVSLVLDHRADEAVMTTGNAVGLRRAVLAILDNAIEHTPDSGKVTLSVRSKGRYVLLQVTDTGPGIPASEIDRVFDRFHSSHQKASRRSYGLGLSLARAVVTRHRGKITVESAVNGGTTFRVFLPHTSR